jgi:mannose-6-phosphate isomerase-like protein (cupin superfamily)
VSVRRPRTVAVLVVASLALVALGALGALAFGRDAAAPKPVRNALAQTEKVQGAPGRTMVLSRVVVPPGAQLALHHHLGTQIGYVQKGTLSYTVRSGSAEVREGESDQGPRLVRLVKPGQTAQVRTGQWLVEQPSDHHEAANRGSVPIVLYISTLLVTGAPPSTPLG